MELIAVVKKWPWGWILGLGAAAGVTFYAVKSKAAQKAAALPAPAPSPQPYIPPKPAPTPYVAPYVAPYVPPPPQPYVQPYQPPPPPPPPAPVLKPVSPGSNLYTVPTVYQSADHQPGPSGTPYSYTTMQVTTQSDPLNLRDSPNGKVIGSMPKGSNFNVDKIEGGWAHGKSQSSGQIGWASTQYLGGGTSESFSSTPYGGPSESFSSGASMVSSAFADGMRMVARSSKR